MLSRTDIAITVVLLGEPRGWARPRIRVVTPKRGPSFAHFYKDAETRAFEKALAVLAKAQMRGRPPLEGPVRVNITAEMAVPKSWSNKDRDAALAGVIRPTGKPDWDNLAKCVDALNEIVWRDDAQVVEGHAVKIYSETPRFVVEVSPITTDLLG